MQVQLLPDALAARSSIGSGQQPLTLQRRVQFPHGSLSTIDVHDQVVQLVDTRRSERRARAGLGVRLSPWSLAMRCNAGAAGAQLAFIRPVSRFDSGACNQNRVKESKRSKRHESY